MLMYKRILDLKNRLDDANFLLGHVKQVNQLF